MEFSRVIVGLTLSAAAFAAGVPSGEYAARRARLASQIGANAMLVVLSAQPSRRNGDVEWPFRQNDNLLYLTSVAEPDTTLVLLPGEQELKEVVFVRDRNPQQELWTGRIPTHEDVTAISGVAKVESNNRLRGFVAAAIEGTPFPTGSMSGQPYQPPGMPAFSRAVREGKGEVWLAFEGRSRGDVESSSSPEMRFVHDLLERYPEIRIRDASSLLRSMRVIKSPAELVVLQKAIDITDAAQKAGMKRALTAASENEVQATIEYRFRNMGACCWGYPSIVASGQNATTLHTEGAPRILSAGSPRTIAAIEQWMASKP